jgi:RNA polymerase sigma-70 factor (ECF subfamily)
MFRAWLLRIARNAALDHFRKTKRRDESSLDADIVKFSDTLGSSNPGPEAIAENSELAQALAGCLGCLNDDQRLAIVMIDIEGYQYEDAAQSMGVSIGTVKSRLNRARARMRDCLQTHPEHLPPSMRL